MLSATIWVSVCFLNTAGFVAQADDDRRTSGFEEQAVEFYNGDVKLAGSLLLPRSEDPVPAVVFVHGAGPQTREAYREVGQFFASQGIATLIYDKRGVGQSGGAYESYEPYTNLVNDALAAVEMLKQRSAIASEQIGMWGLSQGAYISAEAAARSEDVRFVIGVGASAADGTMFYYRENLFRKYGLSDKLLDMANKAQLCQDTLPHVSTDGCWLCALLPRAYPPPHEYVHPAWSRVRQPVLVMWGQLDQHQPVGESVLGLKHSLAQANNDRWTLMILPRAKHSLGISDTGAIQEKWRGYPPGALQTMTDWAWRAMVRPAELDRMKQEGTAEVTGVLAKVRRYEKLRWYGNWMVQGVLLVGFLGSFLATTMAGVRGSWHRVFQRHERTAGQTSAGMVHFKRALCAINLLILVGMMMMVLRVVDQMQPSCPLVLRYLPLVGNVSAIATIALLVMFARRRGRCDWTAGKRIWCSLEMLLLVLFIPYLYYWNMLGLPF